jgi:hypothetical protein
MFLLFNVFVNSTLWDGKFHFSKDCCQGWLALPMALLMANMNDQNDTPVSAPHLTLRWAEESEKGLEDQHNVLFMSL